MSKMPPPQLAHGRSTSILPALGIVQAKEPATYLLTPFQDGAKAYLAFLAQAQKSIHMMIYGFTLAPIVDALIAAKARGVECRILFDHSQAMGTAERPQIDRLMAAGFVDGQDFLIGTSPEHHQINHLKATWLDGEHVLHGSWNYSASASAQYNSIEIVSSPELATLFEEALQFAWQWVQQNEQAYNQPGAI